MFNGHLFSSRKALVCLTLVLDKHKGESGLQSYTLFHFLLLLLSLVSSVGKVRDFKRDATGYLSKRPDILEAQQVL